MIADAIEFVAAILCALSIGTLGEYFIHRLMHWGILYPAGHRWDDGLSIGPVSHHGLGGDRAAGNRRSILKRDAGHRYRVDKAGLH